MKKILPPGFLLLLGAFSTAAVGAPGEWWEISNQIEMSGMPGAMPATTSKVCLATDAKDPPQSLQAKGCEMNDISTSGNRTSWKVRCNINNVLLSGSGDITSSPDSYQGVMHINGTTGDKVIEIKTTYHARRVGPACDPPQPD